MAFFCLVDHFNLNITGLCAKVGDLAKTLF